MSLHEDDIRQILKLIDESNFAEMDLKSGDLHLKVSKHLCAGAPPSASLPSQAEERPLAAPAPPAATLPAPAAAAPPMDSTESQGLLPIHAPTLGIFYRSPKPGAPPFVQEGDLIQDNDTVCIIEVMKLFNHIKAGLRGRVAKVCAENGAMVEHNQLLFLIQPAAN